MAHNFLRILLAASAAAMLACGAGGGTTDNAESPRVTALAGAAAAVPGSGLSNRSTMRVTGCLRRGNQEGTYLLRLLAGQEPLPPSPGESASSTGIAPADWAGARAFLVAAPAGDDLSPYADTAVEVTGSVLPPSLEAKGEERAEAERPHGNPNAPGAGVVDGVQAGGNGSTDAPKGDLPALFRTIQAERVRRMADHCEDADLVPSPQRP